MAKGAMDCKRDAGADTVTRTVSYVEKMDNCIKQLREKEGLVSIRFCSFGGAGKPHRERMAKVFCSLMELRRRNIARRTPANAL